MGILGDLNAKVFASYEDPSDLGSQFDAMVVDKNAPPPPHLPNATLQALGTGPCQITPNVISDMF